jgi:hypothetical protein
VLEVGYVLRRGGEGRRVGSLARYPGAQLVSQHRGMRAPRSRLGLGITLSLSCMPSAGAAFSMKSYSASSCGLKGWSSSETPVSASVVDVSDAHRPR